MARHLFHIKVQIWPCFLQFCKTVFKCTICSISKLRCVKVTMSLCFTCMLSNCTLILSQMFSTRFKMREFHNFIQDYGACSFVDCHCNFQGTLNPFSIGQKTRVNPLRSGFCVQWERAHLPFTPGSVDPAVVSGFFHPTSAKSNMY